MSWCLPQARGGRGTASLGRTLVSATDPGREGYGITGPCLGVCHRPGEGGVLPIMAYTEKFNFLSKDQLTKKKDRILIKDLITNK